MSRRLAHHVCATLIELGFTARIVQNRVMLVDPLRLLKRLGSYHQYDQMNKFLDYFTFGREIDRFVDKLASIDLEYELCGLVGAWLVALHVRPVDVHLYVPSKHDAEEIAKSLWFESYT